MRMVYRWRNNPYLHCAKHPRADVLRLAALPSFGGIVRIDDTRPYCQRCLKSDAIVSIAR